MISFYDLTGNSKTKKLCSRIEDLLGMPQCLEYVDWTKMPGYDPSVHGGKKHGEYRAHEDEKKNKQEIPLETLLVGDDLGFIHKYDMLSPQWHFSFYKDFSELKVKPDLDEFED
jgi:hypothetical protein